MAVYIFTGKLGSGKTLCSVGRIRDKLLAGCRIATNLDLNLVSMFKATANNINIIRVPDKPKLEDLDLIGYGNTSYDEELNGLLVLDECGTWFNSRNWNDKDRKSVNDWFLHARKYGWDVILIIQDIKMLDSQARDALAEHTVFCKRLDRVQVPVLGFLFKTITGLRLRGPRLHIAKCVYGTTPDGLISDRWVYRGNTLFNCYNTKQLFLNDYPHSVYSMLTPWHIKGRYQVPRDKDFYMRMTRIYLKRLTAPLAIAAGIAIGLTAGIALFPLVQTLHQQPEPVADLPSPAAEPELVQDEKSSEDKSEKLPLTVAQSFEDYKIISYIQGKARALYIIAKGEKTFTSEQLHELGYIVRPVNNCQMELSKSKDFQDIAIVYAETCIIRPYDKPALDLKTIPSLDNVASR